MKPEGPRTIMIERSASAKTRLLNPVSRMAGSRCWPCLDYPLNFPKLDFEFVERHGGVLDVGQCQPSMQILPDPRDLNRDRVCVNVELHQLPCASNLRYLQNDTERLRQATMACVSDNRSRRCSLISFFIRFGRSPAFHWFSGCSPKPTTPVMMPIQIEDHVLEGSMEVRNRPCRYSNWGAARFRHLNDDLL